MLLDTYSTVYLWIGSKVTENEKTSSLDLAAKYIAACAEVDGRSVDTIFVKIMAGKEPAMFTCHFSGWVHNASKAFIDPYEAKLAAIKASQSKVLHSNCMRYCM